MENYYRRAYGHCVSMKREKKAGIEARRKDLPLNMKHPSQQQSNDSKSRVLTAAAPACPQDSCITLGTVVLAREEPWPHRTLGRQHQWLLLSAAGPSTTACSRQTWRGRWFETQQMWWRMPERSIAGSGTCWGLPSCFPAVLIGFLSVYCWYRQMSTTKHGQAWREILSVLVSYHSAALNLRPR